MSLLRNQINLIIMAIRPLPKELQEKAIAELKEVPSRLQEDVDHILNWIRQQPHLNARTERQWILAFLRGCKFSLQKTKEKLDAYYSARSIFPFYFKDRNPFAPEIQAVWKLNIFVTLPKDTDCLTPIRYFGISRNADIDQISFKNGLKALLMLVDLDLYDNDAGLINGQEIIVDLKNTPYAYLGQLTPDVLKLFTVFFEYLYPSRIKGIHIINLPKFLQIVVNTVLSFLSKKIRSRVHVYAEGDYDSLFKFIPRNVFPEEFGGRGGTINTLSENCLRRLEQHKEWFEDDAKYGTDESRRIGKLKFSESFGFDLEGSFRKLDID